MELPQSSPTLATSTRSSAAALALIIGSRLALGMLSVVLDFWIACTPYEDLFNPKIRFAGSIKGVE